jgi:hypothetical protein
MPATPRDREKPRAERLAEVFQAEQLQSGQANAQQIIFGLEAKAEGTTVEFEITAGEYAPDGVSLPVAIKAIAKKKLPAGATTGAGQTCLVLVEINAAEEVFVTASALTTGTPVLPALTAGTAAKPKRIAIAEILVPESFTVGTSKTSLCTFTAIVYSAGNKAPTGGF